MHASLAQLSPAVRAFDSIILSRDTRLPTELLLLIRSHLLPLVTTRLLQSSTHALAQYESSIRGLLCFDCVIFNQEIYGPDIWQWEQFSGPCACARVSSMSTFDHSGTPNIREPAPPKSNPKLFQDRLHWLEFHLSSESQHLLGPRVSPDNRSQAIWRVVDEVLNDQDCRVLRGASDHSIYEFFGKRTFSRGRNLATIVSAVTGLDKGEGSSMGDSNTGCRNPEVILHQAKHNLGLDFEYDYEESLENSIISHSRPCPCLLRGLTIDSPTLYSFVFYAQSAVVNINTLQTLAALIAACLSLPLTFATLVLTILCLYSKPQSFRIL